MFDLDRLVEDLVRANDERDARLAVRDVLDRAVADPELRDALGRPEAGLNVMHNSAKLTVLNVVWPPRMTLYPHDHRMWAAIAIYGGREENAFFRRQGQTVVPSGGKALHEGDVLLLGEDAVHSVHNPEPAYTGAIHVYGGDFITAPRSQWTGDAVTEEPYDLESVRREFVRAEREFQKSG
jgi:predicted metal-dependent enzyme (double-stranded beta helix superfamily)